MPTKVIIFVLRFVFEHVGSMIQPWIDKPQITYFFLMALKALFKREERTERQYKRLILQEP